MPCPALDKAVSTDPSDIGPIDKSITSGDFMMMNIYTEIYRMWEMFKNRSYKNIHTVKTLPCLKKRTKEKLLPHITPSTELLPV